MLWILSICRTECVARKILLGPMGNMKKL